MVVADPDLVKQVFTGDPKVFHAGEGNEILRPLLGENSLLVIDGAAPHRASASCSCRLSTAGGWQGYEEKMREIAAREIESWPTGVPYQTAPADAGDDA